MAQLSRRHMLGLGIGALGAPWLRRANASELGAESHGMSAFGDLNYPPDFHHFEYVNVDAPKGGFFSTIPSGSSYNQSVLTFNSLNAFILKGEGALGMELTFPSLMTRAGDEPDAMYGLAAKSVEISPDKTIYRFTLRPEARFHDATKITAHDAAFSLNILKEKGHPITLVLVAFFGGGCRRPPRDGGRYLHQGARARCAAVRRGLADFFQSLLCTQAVRRKHSRNSPRLRPV
jgi:microcin C transport system substrate-binding protein